MPRMTINPEAWLQVARKYLGQKEIKGPAHNSVILKFWEKAKLPFKDDETPWCAGFVGAVLEEAGIESTRSGMARSYEKWGIGFTTPPLGSIVVFWRGSPKSKSGHVGFLVGRDINGNLMILGGNQGDEVSIKPFSADRVLSYRWPRVQVSLMPDDSSFRLPIFNSNSKLSVDES